MSPQAKALREKRAALVPSIRALTDRIHAENRDFDAAEKEQWEKLNNDYNQLTRQIDLEAHTAELEAAQVVRLDAPPAGPAPSRFSPTTVTEEHRALAFQGWCRHQLGHELDASQEEACRLTGMHPGRASIEFPLYSTESYRSLQRQYNAGQAFTAQERVQNFHAALSGVSGPAGAYTIPPETLVRSLEVAMLAFGGVRQVADSIRTTSGERMSWPTANDTTNTGEQLGENASVGSSVDPTFGKVYWDAYKFSSKPVLVPYELLQDSAFSLAGTLGAMLGERLGRITANRFAVGSGASTPKGLVSAATLGKTAASATAVTADEILDLVHSVDPAYRSGARFLMHDNLMLAIRKLKDSSGQYLWTPSVVEGISGGNPDRLWGYPLSICMEMASSMATTNKTILFGQLSKYKIRTVGSVRMYRLEERYRDTDQDGFMAFLREDGNLLDAGVAPVKFLQQA